MTCRMVILVAALLAAGTGTTGAPQTNDLVEDVLRNVPKTVPDLAVREVQRFGTGVMALYDSPDRPATAMPKAIWVTIESYDTDAAAEAGRKRSVDTTSVGPTRTETVNGLAVTWWQKQRALAQIGRHVVNVSALRTEAEPLVLKVLQSLVPGLKTAKGL